MDPASPPKRMTRARAAAQAGGSSARSTKIETAAAKAKTPRTTTTATKRKLRSEDVDADDNRDELELQQQPTAMKATRPRARPRKAAQEPPQTEVSEPKDVPGAASRATRARAPKKAVPEPTKEAPARAARATRAKRGPAGADEPEQRAGPTAKAASKPAVRKTVSFQEPEKENMVPAATTLAKGKQTAKAPEAAATGLRAKPVRRAAAATKSARTTSRSVSGTGPTEGKGPIPLSPKKVNQIRLSRDTDSEDELAVEKTPLKKNPIRPSNGSHAVAKKAEPTADDEPDVPLVVIGTSARRQQQSPYKDSIKSPARRLGRVVSFASTEPIAEEPQSSLKTSLLQSPAKRPQFPSRDLADGSNRDDTLRSPLKLSLFQSPAKRPFASAKGLLPSSADPEEDGRSPAPKPTLLSTPLPLARTSNAEPEAIMDEELRDILGQMVHDTLPASPTRLKFPGRLSAVLPRHADPALKDSMPVLPEFTEDEAREYSAHEFAETAHDLGDPMEVDEPDAEMEPASRQSITPPQSAPKQAMSLFGLRQKDLDPYSNIDSDSEDELTSQFANAIKSPLHAAVPSTPCPVGSFRTPKCTIGQSQSSKEGTLKRLRMDKFGFTPLAEQLSGWRASSPRRAGTEASSAQLLRDEAEGEADILPTTEEETIRPTFFDDEMSVRPHMTLVEADVDDSPETDADTPIFEEIPITREDVALAAEANEMSLMEPEQLEDILNIQGADDLVSEASQEYDDENALPIDPALLPSDHLVGIPPVTPQRVVTRTFHTVSKVPLKPADDSTPRPAVRRRSHSVSRLPTSVQRPNRGLTRNATVISYSPSKRDRQQVMFDEAASEVHEEDLHRAESVPPTTPSKPDATWSTAGTPARTPRQDLNRALLRGAIVFVDVYTTEGADASGIFVELLTQMGARCVNKWSWNPSSPQGGEGSSSKIGITHVVYKDGGKRTLEKVRESGGVVQCVGVSWVLE